MLLLSIDSNIYAGMIKGKALSLRKIIKTMHTNKNIARISLPLQAKDETLNANNLIGAMSKNENKMAIMTKTISVRYCSSIASGKNTREQINNALAGVGKPLKDFFWDSSMLNFASLKAENMAIRNPAHAQ